MRSKAGRSIAAFAVGLVAVLAAVVPSALAKQGPSLRVSSDPYLNPESQHRTEVEPDSFATRNQVVTAFQVGRTFDGGATNIGWATSHNNGNRFASGFLPGITKVAGGTYSRASDPSVAYDAAHGVWLISSLALGEPVRGLAVVVNRSRDGLGWSRPSTVALASGGADFDKNWTACDNNRRSPFYGHCYTEFDDVADADRIKMSTSTDGGVTWSAPANTAGNDLGFGGQPVVQPDGTVIVPIATLGGAGMQAFRSTDGGRTWSAAVRFAAAPVHPVAGGLRVTRGTLFPSAEVDRDGKVYVAWEDCSFRAGCSANDIVFSTTSDGLTWSPVKRIPIDPVDSGADHFIPGLAVDPRSGGSRTRLALTYYSYPESDCTAVSCELDVGFVTSGDGGGELERPAPARRPHAPRLAAEHDPGSDGRRLRLDVVRTPASRPILRRSRAAQRRIARRGDSHRQGRDPLHRPARMVILRGPRHPPAGAEPTHTARRPLRRLSVAKARLKRA